MVGPLSENAYSETAFLLEVKIRKTKYSNHHKTHRKGLGSRNRFDYFWRLKN